MIRPNRLTLPMFLGLLVDLRYAERRDSCHVNCILFSSGHFDQVELDLLHSEIRLHPWLQDP